MKYKAFKKPFYLAIPTVLAVLLLSSTPASAATTKEAASIQFEISRRDRITSHGENILFRMEDKISDLEKLASSTDSQIDRLISKGKDMTEATKQFEIAIEKLDQAKTDVEAVRVVIEADKEPEADTDPRLSSLSFLTNQIRSALKIADQSVAKATSALAQMKKYLREPAVKIRK